MSARIKSIAAPGRPRFKRLEQWLKWQEGLHFTAIELGLERCRQVAANLGLLRPAHSVISVAGTNGKGSSVVLLDEILRAAGYRTGRYTSPHLLRYSERICVNGREIGADELCAAFERIDRARAGISLTYFEFGTLAALALFRAHQVEIALLEVGLGGRLDAVNVLDADAALITSIDLDHQQWLGDNRERIAREKAGILRNRAPAVCSDPNPPRAILDCAGALGAPLSLPGRDYFYAINGDHWDWRSAATELTGLPRPLRYSAFQVQNAAGVLMLLDKIRPDYPVDRAAIQAGINRFRLNGRLQIIPGEVQKVLDVAHNPQAARALAGNLCLIPCVGKTHILIGMLKDKDHRGVLKPLNAVADSWHIVSLAGQRGMPAPALMAELKALGVSQPVRAFAAVKSALARLGRAARPGDRIVITGSFITVGEALRHFAETRQCDKD